MNKETEKTYINYKSMSLSDLREAFKKLIEEQKKKGYVDIGFGSYRVPNNPTKDIEDNEKRWLISVLSMFQCFLNEECEELWHMTPKGERVNYDSLSLEALRDVFNVYMEHEKAKGMVGHFFTSKGSFVEDGKTEDERERENMINIMSTHDCYLNGESEAIASVHPKKRRYDFEERQDYEDVTDTIH